jgi:hypothetical protein
MMIKLACAFGAAALAISFTLSNSFAFEAPEIKASVSESFAIEGDANGAALQCSEEKIGETAEAAPVEASSPAAPSADAAVAAIPVDIIETATVVVRGQKAEDNEDLAITASITSMQTRALDANADGSESVAILDCDTEDGMGACPVDAWLADGGQTSPAAIEPPATQTAATVDSEAPITQALATEAQAAEELAAPSVHSIDAIIAEVIQSVTIAVPGENAGVSEEAGQTGSISEPSATEPDLVADEKTALEAVAAPSVEAADAIAVEVTQSVTIAAPGQDIASNEDLAYTGSITEPAATEPVSSLDAASSDDLE